MKENKAEKAWSKLSPDKKSQYNGFIDFEIKFNIKERRK